MFGAMADTELIDLPAPTADTPLNAITVTTADAVRKNPKNAAAVFAAEAVGADGVKSDVALRSFSITVDEPPVLGGSDSAPNPVEYYLASLLSCQVVTYRFWAQRLGIQVDSLALRAEGDLDVRGFFGLDDDVRPGFGAVRIVVDVSGPDTEARYAELHEAVEKHCPVLDLTTNPTPVSSELRVTTV